MPTCHCVCCPQVVLKDLLHLQEQLSLAMGAVSVTVLTVTLAFSLYSRTNSLPQLSHSQKVTRTLTEGKQRSTLLNRVSQDTQADQKVPECSGQQITQDAFVADYLLLGYNSLKGNPLRSGRDPGFTLPIFSTEYNSGHVTPDCRSNVPEGVIVSSDVSCVTSFTSKVVATPYDLTKLLSVTAHVGDVGWGPSFSASDDFRTLSHKLRDNILVVSTATCSSYHVTLSPLEPPPFSSVFLHWILKLTDTDDDDVYLEFLHTFGTHFVSRARFGASLTLVHTMEDSDYRRQTQSHVTAAATYFAAARLGHSLTLTPHQQEAADKFANEVETTTIAVGVPPPADLTSVTWLTSVRENPMAISYDLTSVESLFSDPLMGKDSRLKRYAIDHVRVKAKLAAMKDKYCQKLKREGLVLDCEQVAGVKLLQTKLIGRSRLRNVTSANQCVEKCYQLPGCVAVTYCAKCDSNEVGHKDCHMFRVDDIHSAVTDPQRQTTILTNKLQTLLMLHNTSTVAESDNITVTSARECMTSCSEDDLCLAFTLSDSHEPNMTCSLHSDSLLLSFKQSTENNVFFLAWHHKSISRITQTNSFPTSSLTKDLLTDCVIDDDCSDENAMCSIGRCLCLPGFFFSSRDNKCLTTCRPRDLQDTFMEYSESEIKGHILATQDGIKLKTCKKLCVSTDHCLTFDFRDTGGRCVLHDVTSREAVSGWFPLTSTGWTHYQRTCLKSAASYPGPAWYNSSCTQDTDCPDPFSLCSSGRCLCALGDFSSKKEVTCRAAESCGEWQKAGAKSGAHFIRLKDKKETSRVWCDMDSSGGGWLVFQRRRDGSVDFYRNWTQYEDGFGDVTGEFWLGLSRLHTLTKGRPTRLRVDLGEVNGHRHYAEYSTFRVDGPETNYRLTVSGYSGDAGDSMENHNNQSFSTFDRDNDKDSANCASLRHGAWWYNACLYSNINGRYKADGASSSDGMKWFYTHNDWRGFTFSEMKVQPV
ncbi:uncharacterized protein LOC112568963 isoform X2 [Pomacea canaliculata]|uniref:uncharacterized protein LOC112568963 isoform X2 n=1 Tax=Pomacea canaliculata TaxID=400727 RepID=UPI000D732A8E|nr:uncharacterized protein LOC112568963 isoform X2 [Pomacea canaliculata]